MASCVSCPRKLIYFPRGGKMLFIGSLCRGISLKFLCTSLLWGPGEWASEQASESLPDPLWWHHVVAEAFPLGPLADPWLRHGTPSLHPHTAHILAYAYLLPLLWTFFFFAPHSPFFFFKDCFGLFIPALSPHSHFSLAPSVFPTETTGSPNILSSVSWDLWGWEWDYCQPTCNFLSSHINTDLVSSSPPNFPLLLPGV